MHSLLKRNTCTSGFKTQSVSVDVSEERQHTGGQVKESVTRAWQSSTRAPAVFHCKQLTFSFSGLRSHVTDSDTKRRRRRN